MRQILFPALVALLVIGSHAEAVELPLHGESVIRFAEGDEGTPTVLLVQTTGQEESGAAYCRGNAIVLPRNMVRRADKSLEKTLTHELFHILSSHNKKLRSARVADGKEGGRPFDDVPVAVRLQIRVAIDAARRPVHGHFHIPIDVLQANQ